MRLYFASIPVLGDSVAETELNQFLASHRVVSLERHLVEAGAASVWAICVAYKAGHAGAAEVGVDTGKKSTGRVDYREVLNDQEFAAFAELRNLRKTLAEQEGVPPYALFTNEHLAAMVQRPVSTLEELAEINGVGKARMEKYGEAFLSLLQTIQMTRGSADSSADRTHRSPERGSTEPQRTSSTRSSETPAGRGSNPTRRGPNET